MSATQFNREYRNTYGLPPGQDAARLRATHPPPHCLDMAGIGPASARDLRQNPSAGDAPVSGA